MERANGDEQRRHPIEVEQRRVAAEIDELTVHDAVVRLLDLDPEEAVELLARQLVAADGQVERYAREMRSTRRAAVGVGFFAGVSFAVAVQRVRDVDV